MKYIILDTETVDLHDDVIQMSFIVLDDKYKIMAFESFYCDTNKRVSDGAYSVHGLTNEFVHEQSGGKYLEDYLFNNPKYKELFFDEEKVLLIGYNVDYDLTSINNTLMSKTGLTLPKINQVVYPLNINGDGYFKYDLMTFYKNLTQKKYGYKLVDMVNSYLNEYDLEGIYKSLVKRFDLNVGENYHDAAFDTFCTLMLFYECLKRV